MAPSCKKEEEKESKLNLELIKETAWYYSNEEFSGDTVYFRPDTYEFPRSRGREGFKFLDEQGAMEYYAISPADMPMKMKASWKFENDILTIDIPGNEYARDRNLQFKVLEVKKDRITTLEIY